MSSAPYYPALDGLRAFFVVSVLLFHAEVPWAAGGFLGVSSFFTLSGFLITRLLLGEWQRAGTIDLRRFWTRRFRRLMPASLLGLALVLLIGDASLTRGELAELRGDVWSALAYVSNWRFMWQARSYFEIFDRPSPVQHFWSLSIEEQFYLCYPLLVLGVWRLGAERMRNLAIVLLALGVAGVATGIALVAVGTPQSRIYYGTDTRAPELLVGALLALWMSSRRDDGEPHASTDAAAIAGALVLVAGIAWIREDARSLAYGGLVANALATAAVVHAGVRRSHVGRLLAARPLTWLGRVSYGVYVYHWPVYLVLDPERTGLAVLPLFALRATVTIGLAALSYVLVERPIRTGRALVGRRLWVGGVATILAIAVLADRVTHDARAIVASLHGTVIQRRPPVTDPDATRVLVVGDSVADNIAGGLQAWVATTSPSMVIWNLGFSACAIGRGGERPALRNFPQMDNRCAEWRTSWSRAVERLDPDVVVVHTGPLDLVDRRLDRWGGVRSPGDPEFEAWLVGELQAAADLLGRRGARLIWLTTPCPGPPTTHAPLFATGALEPSRIVRLNSFILPSLTTLGGGRLRLFDLYGVSCPKGEFQRWIPGTRTPLRSDYLHFSEPGALWVAERLGPIVVAAARIRRGALDHPTPTPLSLHGASGISRPTTSEGRDTVSER